MPDFSTQHVYCVFQDKKKRTWIGAGTGLYQYSYEQDTMVHYPIDIPDSFKHITSIQEDSKGNLWLACRADFIIKYNPEIKSTDLIPIKELPDIHRGHKVLLVDQNDQVWLALSRFCFSHFNPENGSFKHYFVNRDGSGLYVRDLLHLISFDDDHILIATDQGGINIFNKKTERFHYVSSFIGNAGELTSDGILFLHKDEEGIIWAATSRGGVCYYNPKEHNFKVFQKKGTDFFSNKNMNLSNGVVGCLMEDSQGLIWIGTDGGGINILDRKTGHIRVLNTENSKLRFNTVRSMSEDKDGNVIICLWPNTLDKYIRKKDEIEPLNMNTSYLNEYVWTTSIDYKNRLWLIGGSGNVAMLEGDSVAYLNEYNTQGNFYEATKVYCHQNNSEIRLLLPSIGMYQWNEKTNEYDVPIYLGSDIVQVEKDNEGNLWVGTANKGVLMYKKNSNDTIYYNTSNGLSNNQVKSMLIDNLGNVWVATNNGLNQISVKDSIIYTYSKEDGLQGNQYFTIASLLTNDGALFFGGNQGLDSFYPDKIQRNDYLPKVFVESVNVIAQNKRENYLLYPQNSDTIYLKWYQSRLEISFFANNFTFKKKTKFKYNLTSSLDNNIKITDGNYAIFNYLKPGSYKFEVFAANSDGLWNKEGYSLYFIVKEKMWQRTWFYFFLAFMIVLIIYIIIIWREKNLRRAKVILERKVKTRTQTIEKQNDLLMEQHEELFVQKEELQQHKDHLENMIGERTTELVKAKEKAENSDRLKSYFLANMSHEIRTPMNAIIGFSSLLEDDSIEEEEKHGFIELIVRNSNALLLLIEDILDFSQIEANQLKIRKEEFSVNRLLDEVYSTFSLRNENPVVEIKKENQLKSVDLHIYSDEYRIRQILFNLMGNALKFTKSGSISLGVIIVDSNVKFYVKDSGVGMSEGEVKVIFNQFVKLNRDQVSAKRGIGLGLAISKRLAKLLGGELSVESKPKVGSTFILSLPYEQSLEDFSKKVKEIKVASTVNWEDKRILVVEDEQANFKFLEELLKKTKVKIDYVEDGLQAVQNCDKCDKYDVVLMDIRLPIMNGYEALMKIKAACKKQIVIAQTAYARPEDKVKIKEAGFTDYMAKPFLPKDIIDLLQKYLGA